MRCYNKIVTVKRGYQIKRSGWWNSWLCLNLYSLAIITLTLILSSAIWEKGINLVGKDFELPSALFYESCRSLKKYVVLCGNNSVWVKVMDSLICVTNLCVKVTAKYILPSVSRVKLHWQVNFVLIIWVE